MNIQHIIRIYKNIRHPEKMGGKEIGEFLTYLAVEKKASASLQNQALNAQFFVIMDGFPEN